MERGAHQYLKNRINKELQYQNSIKRSCAITIIQNGELASQNLQNLQFHTDLHMSIILEMTQVVVLICKKKLMMKNFED